jgi:hypothetical protein
MGFILGRKVEYESLFFLREVIAADYERCFFCAVGAAA